MAQADAVHDNDSSSSPFYQFCKKLIRDGSDINQVSNENTIIIQQKGDLYTEKGQVDKGQNQDRVWRFRS